MTGAGIGRDREDTAADSKKCQCGELASMVLTKNGSNTGRYFYTCSKTRFVVRHSAIKIVMALIFPS